MLANLLIVCMYLIVPSGEFRPLSCRRTLSTDSSHETKISIVRVGIDHSTSDEISFREKIGEYASLNHTPNCLRTRIYPRPVFGSLLQIIPDTLGYTPFVLPQIGPIRGPISTLPLGNMTDKVQTYHPINCFLKYSN